MAVLARTNSYFIENQNCKYGIECNFKECKYYHPFDKFYIGSTPNQKIKDCIYGNNCRFENFNNKQCIFIHP